MWTPLLFALACQPEPTPAGCPSFDDTRLVTEAPGADAADEGLARAALDDFAAWTGLDGVCVAQVRLVEATRGCGGADACTTPLASGGLDIQLKAPGGQGLYADALHELCHAADRGLNLSGRHRDLFLPRNAQPDDDRPALGPVELVVDYCESGPLTLAIAEQACPDDPRVDLVLSEVYAGDWALPFEWAPFTTSEGPSLALPPSLAHPESGRVYPLLAGEELVLWDSDDEGLGYVLTPYSAHRDGEGFERAGEPFVARLGARLLDGDQAAPLLTTNDGGAQVWIVDGEPSQVEGWPEDIEPWYAVRVGDALWADGYSDVGQLLHEVSLDTGEVRDWPLPEALARGWFDVVATGDGVVAMALGGLSFPRSRTSVVATLDPATGTWRHLELPEPLEAIQLAVIDERRVFLRWRRDTSYGAPLLGYALGDLDAGTWQVGNPSCTSDDTYWREAYRRLVFDGEHVRDIGLGPAGDAVSQVLVHLP